mgnify:CR=1 FL=1
MLQNCNAQHIIINKKNGFDRNPQNTSTFFIHKQPTPIRQPEINNRIHVSQIEMKSILSRELKISRWRNPLERAVVLSNGDGSSCAVNQFSRMDKRFFAVRELPWCAPKSSSNRNSDSTKRAEPKNGPEDKDKDKDKNKQTIPAIERFGVVAAMARNRVIGLNGNIPWTRCAQDRTIFKDLTRNGILIIGRHTYEEEPMQRHIDHTKFCIVISKTLQQGDIVIPSNNPMDTQIKVAKSLPEALVIAKDIADENYTEETSDYSSGNIICWVAGGQRIYEEALRHISATQVHLTTMSFDVDIKSAREESLKENKPLRSAMFPSKHNWDRPFKKVSEKELICDKDDPENSVKFTYEVYERVSNESGWHCCR